MSSYEPEGACSFRAKPELSAFYQEELANYEEAKRIAEWRPQHEFFVLLAKLNCENAKAALDAEEAQI